MHTKLQKNTRKALTRRSAFTVFLNRFCQTFNDVMQHK